MNREDPAPLLLESQIGPLETPYSLDFLVSLGQTFSDNFEQEEEPHAEYRTSLTLETVYRYERGPGFLSLANSLSGNYDARAEEVSFGFVNFTLNTGYRLPRVQLALSNHFVRSDDLEEPSAPGVRDTRGVFWRNTLSPQIRYTWSRRTSLGLGYTNTIVLNEEEEEGEEEGDSITHAVTTDVEHQFSRSWAGRLSYAFTYTDEENVDPVGSHTASAGADYLFSRSLSFLFEAFGATFRGGNDDEDNADSLGATIGARYRLARDLGLIAAVGVVGFNDANDGTRVFATWEAGLDGTWQITRTTGLTFTTTQGIENTGGEVDFVGLVLRQTVALQLDHNLSRRLQLSLLGDYTYTEVLASSEESDEGRKDHFWSTGARALFNLTPRWSLAVDYFYRRLDSSQNEEDFEENRVMIDIEQPLTRRNLGSYPLLVNVQDVT